MGARRVLELGLDTQRVAVDDLDLGFALAERTQEVAGGGYRHAGGLDLPQRASFELDRQVETAREERDEPADDENARDDDRDAPQPGEVDGIFAPMDALDESHQMPSTAGAGKPKRFGCSLSEVLRARI